MALRILQVSSAYYPYPSGVTEAVHNLSVALSSIGHSVSILTTSFKLKINDEVKTDIPVQRFGRALLIPGNKSYATFPFGLKIPFQVRNFLRKNHFDVIHMHGIFPPEIGFWALHYSRAVNVTTINTYNEKLLAVPISLIEGLFKRYLVKLHGRIAISSACKSSIERFIPGDYRIIPHGVDIHAFSPQTPPFADLSRFGCPVLLFLGRIDKRKGLEVILKALPRILKELGTVKLVVVGTGPELASAQALTNRLGIQQAVVFKGFVPREDLPRYYASCDTYISPAIGGEAQGIVLLEGMASGKAVIASNIAGYNETIRNGETGLLFPPGDAEALSRTVMTVLQNTDLRKRLERNGRQESIANSWQSVAQRIENYYYELLAIRQQPVARSGRGAVTG
jgi:phosphatidylinositol alpha-mannosyltransferase